METCFECKKIIWPWQKKSLISFTPLHLKCHQKILDEELYKHPEMRWVYREEIQRFERTTKQDVELQV